MAMPVELFQWDTRRYLKKWLVILGVATLAGVVGGFGALVFRLMIRLFNRLFFSLTVSHLTLMVHGLNLGYVVLPVLGGLLIAPLVRRYPELRGNGIPEVIEGIILKSGRIGAKFAVLKTLATAISIGSGGPLGREGPVGFIGAALGSEVAKKLRNPHMRKLVTTCGLAAGIAGTFNTPLAGAMFGLEVIYMGAISINLVPIFVSAIIGNAITMEILHSPSRFPVVSTSTDFLQSFPFYILLGMGLGVLGYLYTRGLYRATDSFDALSERVPFVVRLIIGGAGVGVLGMLFPSYGIFGIGFDGIRMAILGKFALGLLLALAVTKMLATLLSISSGFSGGIFAPSLYIGTMLGSAFGLAVSHIIPINLEAYALAGMAGFFSAATQAPLTQIIMITEMSGVYTFAPPVALTSVVAFITARTFFRGSSVYTIKLERRGIHIKTGKPLVLETIAVHEIMSTEVVYVTEDATLLDVERIIGSTGHDYMPVVDSEGRVVGVIGVSDVLGKPTALKKLSVSRHMKRDFAFSKPNETAQDALEKLLRSDQNLLPVVDDEMRLLGVVTKKDIYRAYFMGTEGVYLD
ncbi:MAG: chloride channel protein [Thermococci archaeon]|nr:chloride channel protein [Thermococci archaeon]